MFSDVNPAYGSSHQPIWTYVNNQLKFLLQLLDQHMGYMAAFAELEFMLNVRIWPKTPSNLSFTWSMQHFAWVPYFGLLFLKRLQLNISTSTIQNCLMLIGYAILKSRNISRIQLNCKLQTINFTHVVIGLSLSPTIL